MNWREIEDEKYQEGKKLWIKVLIISVVFSITFISIFVYLVVCRPY